MLVSFTVENWKSYRDEITLDMTADKSRQHMDSLAVSKYYRGLRILPIAAVFGGNAAGKSNLFDAIRFVKWFVTTSAPERTAIPVEPFDHGESKIKLSEQVSFFSIQMLVQQPNNGEYMPTRTRQKEIIYQLDFSLNRYKVVDETLSWFDSKREEHVIYQRDDKGHIEFSDELVKKLDDETYSSLKAYVRGTGDRRLFLTNTVDQQLPTFRHVYNWFQSGLRTADNSMQTPYMATLMDNDEYCHRLGQILHALGTGVDEVRLDDVDLKNSPQELFDGLHEMIEHAPDNATGQIIVRAGGDVTSQIYAVTKQNGSIKLQRVQTYRDGQPFGFERESSGTRRLIEIFPIFLDLWTHNTCTWVLDEMEREFHADMTSHILQAFLESCTSNTRTQVLINTHDLMIMDRKLLRKDEMFVVERDHDGVSSLRSIGEYAGIRNDLDIRRSYLDGRFGGLPAINTSELSEAVHGEQNVEK